MRASSAAWVPGGGRAIEPPVVPARTDRWGDVHRPAVGEAGGAMYEPGASPQVPRPAAAASFAGHQSQREWTSAEPAPRLRAHATLTPFAATPALRVASTAPGPPSLSGLATARKAWWVCKRYPEPWARARGAPALADVVKNKAIVVCGDWCRHVQPWLGSVGFNTVGIFVGRGRKNNPKCGSMACARGWGRC